MFRRVNSGTQKVETFETLATFTGSGSGTVKFRVPIPDSRLRVKISLLYIPPAGSLQTVGNGSSLWLYEAEEDMSGVAGSTIPCANIEGTSAAPTVIPVAAGLQGYSREFISSADYIEGVAVLGPGTPTVAGSWVLQCRYQPQAVRFTDDEWNQIATRCNPALTQGPIAA